ALDARVRLFGAGVRPDGGVPDGGALALRGIVHVPVGTSDAYFADSEWRTDVSAIADLEMFGMGVGGAFGYRYRHRDGEPTSALPGTPAESLSLPIAAEHALRLSVGLRMPLPLISRVLPGRVQEAALLELDVQTSARDFFASSET